MEARRWEQFQFGRAATFADDDDDKWRRVSACEPAAAHGAAAQVAPAGLAAAAAAGAIRRRGIGSQAKAFAARHKPTGCAEPNDDDDDDDNNNNDNCSKHDDAESAAVAGRGAAPGGLRLAGGQARPVELGVADGPVATRAAHADDALGRRSGASHKPNLHKNNNADDDDGIDADADAAGRRAKSASPRDPAPKAQLAATGEFALIFRGFVLDILCAFLHCCSPDAARLASARCEKSAAD